MSAEMAHNDDFYVRYYVGHRGLYGHEFFELELHPSGKLRYVNNSNYKHESMVRREVFVGPAVTEEFKRIITESGITQVDDQNWDEPKARQQELEIKIANQHIAFTCPEIGSLVDIQKSKDPEGLKTFYFLTQDLKCLVLSLINMHFKAKPIP
jgi:protein mago nashi